MEGSYANPTLQGDLELVREYYLALSGCLMVVANHSFKY